MEKSPAFYGEGLHELKRVALYAGIIQFPVLFRLRPTNTKRKMVKIRLG